MAGLSAEQEEKRASIQKSATITGGIVGVIAGLLALWLLGGQGGAVRFGGAIVIGGVVGFLVFKAAFKSGAKSALCGKCGAAFSRSRTDHAETVTGSAAKEEREEQADKSVKVTTWTEDSLDVTDTYACAKCGDETTETSQTTRRRDETSVVEPFVPPKKTSAKGGKAAAAAATKGATAGAKGGKSGPARKGSSRSG